MTTTEIRYHGPHDGVELEDGQTCGRGRTVKVAPDLARRLLEQADNFAPVKRAAKPTKAAKTPTPAPTPED